ncbi:MAG TPA: YihY/virulence factor BrkB family protein [Longimicrobiales bacterium]|nr:YihY/virulence factor BrkB family protein [Longimicrobiales bacterium]
MPEPSLLSRGWAAFLDLVRRVYDKAGEDDIFFMAGAIAFNVIVAVVPLLLTCMGIAGFLLRQRFGDPAAVLRGFILSGLPSSPELAQFVESTLRGLLAQSASFLSVGTLLLVFFATRLIGTLRTALREIFDLTQDRGIIGGKLFDMRMVLATGALFAVNVGITVGVDLVSTVRLSVLGYELYEPGFVQRFVGEALAFLSVWTMFLLIYRYLPARRTGWETSVVAATFTAVLFEVMKQVFSLYVTRWADYRSTYGGLATLVVLVLWIYYSAVGFILGGEVAQVVAMKRIRRRQKERLG